MNIVYALHRPDEDYRYIGVTRQSPGARMSSHRTARLDLPVSRWVRKYPDVSMTVIDVLDTYEEALEMEKYWIAAAGRESLLNLTDGGEGVIGWRRSEESKARIGKANSGKTPSAETRQKQREAKIGTKNPHVGVPRSEDSKSKISAATAGEGNPAAKIIWEIVREIRASNESGPTLAKRYGITRTQVSRIKLNKSWKEQ